MNRIALYFGAWAALVAAALVFRYTVLAGTAPERRFALGMALMLVTFAILAGANIYESRRIALLAGQRGRGTFGYLRGWAKTAHVDLAVDDSRIPVEAERQYRIFRISSLYVVASLAVFVPLIIF